MKLHNLKIRYEYMQAKLDGVKPFEIRKNDRNYQEGDLVRYTVIDNEKLNEVVKDKIYTITYITNYEQKDGYVVFTDKEVAQ